MPCCKGKTGNHESAEEDKKGKITGIQIQKTGINKYIKEEITLPTGARKDVKVSSGIDLFNFLRGRNRLPFASFSRPALGVFT